MITNYGKSGLALFLAGSGTLPLMCDIGTGSSALSPARSGLVTPVATAYFSSRNISIANQVSYSFDFSSITMSGLTFSEFGVRTSGGGLGSGGYFSIDNVTPVLFNGTNELQVQVNYKIY